MTLGEKLKKARMDKGLTQSQTAGDQITRNMLSRLEHDAAAPSIKTLEYLSGVLEVPMSWLLEEDPADDRAAMLDRARERYRLGDYRGCAALLPQDGHGGEEEKLLLIRSLLAWAGQCCERNHLREAAQIAEQALSLCEASLYAADHECAEAAYILACCSISEGRDCTPWVALYARSCRQMQLDARLHLLQAELLLSSDAWDDAERELWALGESGEPLQTEQLILRGELELRRGQPEQALLYLLQAEQHEQKNTRQLRRLYAALEQSCRAMDDYKRAYQYSVLQLQLERGEQANIKR